MYIACLTPAADPSIVRRAMCGVPRVDRLVLAAGDSLDGDAWLLSTLRDLRRELFLDPELRVLATTGDAIGKVLGEVAAMLVEIKCETMPIGVVGGGDMPAICGGVASLDPEVARQALATAVAQPPTGERGRVETARVQIPATPLVDALTSDARVVLASSTAAGSLALAASFDALQLDRRNWHQLATVATLARLVEHRETPAPLWLEIDETGAVCCLGADTLTAEAVDRCLERVAADLRAPGGSPDVGIDLSQVVVEHSGAGRFVLAGVKGFPPDRRLAVEIGYRCASGGERHHTTATIDRNAVEWDTAIQTATHWARHA